MTDVDGSKDDVWVATGARTLEIARQYYNCSTLSGLPLMGENPLGDGSRGSHWETRLLADDIMAYGDGGVVSAFTLAMLEGTDNHRRSSRKVDVMRCINSCSPRCLLLLRQCPFG